ncbi:MAG: hypothetical protein WC895_04720, partial [Candidatus Shapirobacteria bacterium]
VIENVIEEDYTNSDLKLYNANSEKLAKRGIVANPAQLGSGAQGTVYDIGNNKTFKITNDEAEAESVYHLLKMNKDYSHIVKYYDVFKFPREKDQKAHITYYGVVMEKLQKLSQDQKDIVRFALQNLLSHSDSYVGSTWDELVQNAIKNFSTTRSVDYANAMFDAAKDIGMDIMFEQLAESKIIHHDLHCNNVMFKDGHVVAIDFGFSESPGKEPPVIERVIRELSADDINIADLAFYLQGKYKEKVNVRTGGNWRTKVLGAGSYGVAFDLGNSMVLKVTTDVSEAKAMNHVKQNGHNLKHVVKVLDIFKFKEDDMIPDSGVFGIVMEKLEQLSNDEKVEFDKMMGSLDYVADLSNVFKTDKTWEKHLETFEVTMKKMNVSNQRFSKERFDNMIELCKKYQMPQINDELHSLNIVFLDFHGENVMKRGSDYVMIDLGASSKSPGAEPPTLEKV